MGVQTLTTQNTYIQSNNHDLSDKYTITLNPQDLSGQSVLININQDSRLNESWKYKIVLTKDVESIIGHSCDK